MKRFALLVVGVATLASFNATAQSSSTGAAGQSAPTFAKDVAPIMFTKCANCHRPGEVAPMSLLSYEDARPWAKAIKAKGKVFGMCFALGRTIATDYYVISLLHSAGGRMFDAANKSEVVFDSPQTSEALTFVKELQPYMPKGAVEYSFLQVVDAHVTGQTAMSFYWGRTLGRAAEEAKPVFAATEALGCTSSKASLNTFISVPVAVLNAATMALNASSSAGTKRLQRITVSLAPDSAFQGEVCAQALAKSNSAGPVSAPAAASAVPP